jgi:hypothetical protein
LRGGIVLGRAAMPAATAAARVKPAGGIERIVEGGHDASCLMLRHMEQGACHAPGISIVQSPQSLLQLAGNYEKS